MSNSRMLEASKPQFRESKTQFENETAPISHEASQRGMLKKKEQLVMTI